MKLAIISDIHGNLEALSAVLEDIDQQKVDALYCLGDVVGYGPNPCECLSLVRQQCQKVILGNHDQGALFDPEGFNIGAERAIRWTRDQLERHDQRLRHPDDSLSDFGQRTSALFDGFDQPLRRIDLPFDELSFLGRSLAAGEPFAVIVADP